MKDTDFEREVLMARAARMEPGRCVLCKHLNPPDSNYCVKCGLNLKDPLKFSTIKDLEEKYGELLGSIVDLQKTLGNVMELVTKLMNAFEKVLQRIKELELRIKNLEGAEG
ncbi:unnamed protein product [marine sediment metagenome]|uniref:Zinc-ribbon domain-containing protein n=1 Tax=marine sediment metagenome TaxID=412755 RepID=X1UB29_9ZZZZ